MHRYLYTSDAAVRSLTLDRLDFSCVFIKVDKIQKNEKIQT